VNDDHAKMPYRRAFPGDLQPDTAGDRDARRAE